MSVNCEIDCPVETAVAAIGGKWKLVLIYHLISGAKRYSELQRLLPNASDRMLTRSLRELEQDNLVSREIFAQVPVRVEYDLTEDGKALLPILETMSVWGHSRLSA
ncbi:Transcriptional regulator, HxlR family [hydrothermal vent metagenome]|uniref:Transcriptional regulator, HxlR family n=1 Tax=hydrothermal vent metagenome TaxID=652676 RepID=A0A3B0U1G6_9ZZZZ